MPSSVDSLDDNSSVASSYDEEEERRIAQQEWEDSLNQLQQLVGVVLMPFFGKWLGRRWSHIGSFVLPSPPHVSDKQPTAYARYLRLGFGKAFFLGLSKA